MFSYFISKGVENVNDRLGGQFFCWINALNYSITEQTIFCGKTCSTWPQKKYCRMTCIFQQNNNVNTLLFALPFCTENTRDQFLTKCNILFLSLNFSNVFFFNKKKQHIKLHLLSAVKHEVWIFR